MNAMMVEEAMKLVFDGTAPLQLRREAFCTIWGATLPGSEKARIVNLVLGDEQSELRQAAATAAGAMGDGSTVEVLRKVLETERDDDIWRHALMSISQLLGPSVIPTLLNLLKQGDRQHQRDALGVLGGFEGEDVTDALRETLTHPDDHMRFLAALCLANRGVREAASVLLDHLHAESAVSRIHAACALAELRLCSGLEYLQAVLSHGRLQMPERNSLLLFLRPKLRPVQKKRTDEEVFDEGRAWVAAQLARD